MKTIKNYWALIITSIIAILGLTAYVNKRRAAKQVAKIDDQIDQNQKQVDVNAGKIDAIEDIKQDIKQDVVDLKNDVEDLQDQKNNIQVETPVEVVDIKENILTKTNKKRVKKKKS